MGIMMASQDVAAELQKLHTEQASTAAKLQFHERLHEQNAKTLEEVKNVLIETAKNTQQLQHMERRFDVIDSRLNNHSSKIDANHAQIMKWGGGISVVMFLLTAGRPWIEKIFN